ncbi:MAG: carboxypeptidase M32 [Planctomycetota bacterium]
MADTSSKPFSDPYPSLLTHQREVSLLSSTGALLGWDQETMLPPGGHAFRTDQLAQLARLTHEMATDPRVGDWLAACEADAGLSDVGLDSGVNLRAWRHAYDRATKLPAELVVAFSEATSQAKTHWAEARRENDYDRFAPWLDRIVSLCREQAACYGWDRAGGGEAWDALAEGYEPGLTAAAVERVFTPLRGRLVALIDRLMGVSQAPDDAFNKLELPVDQQQSFVRSVSQAVGFDFNRGRLDVSAHPFCSGTHYADVRLTTRFHRDNFNDALGSTLHETGHGLYEQGLPPEHVGTPRGQAAGLSIHESQSRLWENQVGRSRAFWTWCHPRLVQHFGGPAAGYSADQMYAAANRVSPSLIRVEADEATYNLHIMVRFELERALMSGELEAADLPAAWNEKYRQTLGVEVVGGDAQGCLQDIHWSMGAIGYFPTYTMGSLYSAQFFEAARAALGGADALDQQFAAGRFGPLLGWLGEQIHTKGQTHYAADLCEAVTGNPLSADPLLRHLEAKLLPLYGL